MQKIFFLLLLIWYADSHPVQYECESENRKALTCQREISTKLGRFFPPGFLVNHEAISAFKKCFGVPRCLVSKKKMDMLQTKEDLFSELAELSPCISEERYRNTKNACFMRMEQNCNYTPFITCMTEKLEQFDECTLYEITKFQGLKSRYEHYCELKTELKSINSSHRS